MNDNDKGGTHPSGNGTPVERPASGEPSAAASVPPVPKLKRCDDCGDMVTGRVMGLCHWCRRAMLRAEDY